MSTRLADRVRFARALRSRSFALLWAGQTVSSLGNGAFSIALAWQVLLLTGSATAMGEVLIAQSIPRLIFLLVGGVLADRLPRRLILLWSDGGRATLVLLIAALGRLHVLQFWHLIALGVLFGVVGAFFIPAYQAMPPQLVPTDDLASANSLNGLSRQLSDLAGPALGASLVAATGPAAAFAFDGLTFVVSALCLLAMRLPVAAPPARAKDSTRLPTVGPGPAQERRRGLPGMLADLREGFVEIMRHTWLWVTTVVASVGNVCWATLSVSLPKLVHNVYGQSVWLLGAIFSVSAAGSILATVIVGQMRRLRHRGPVAYLAVAFASIALLALGLPVPHTVVIEVALAAAAVMGLGLGTFDIVYYTTLQQLVPADKLGRVSSIDWVGSFAFQPIGLALVGVLTDRLGPAPVFVLAGALAVAMCVVALSVRGIRDLD